MSRQSRPPSRTQSFERTRRFFKSVSDIYGKDEMEELLDEIQHLEPCNFQSRDIQDVRFLHLFNSMPISCQHV